MQSPEKSAQIRDDKLMNTITVELEIIKKRYEKIIAALMVLREKNPKYVDKLKDSVMRVQLEIESEQEHTKQEIERRSLITYRLAGVKATIELMQENPPKRDEAPPASPFDIIK